MSRLSTQETIASAAQSQFTTRVHGLSDRGTAGRLLILVGVALAVAVTISLPPAKAAAILLAAGLVIGVAIVPRIGLYALAITVPWGSLLPITVGGFQVTPSDIVVGTLAMVLIGRAAYYRRGPVPSTFWNTPIALFIFAMLLSLSQATALSLSFKELLKWLELAVVFWAAPQLLRSERDIARLIAVIVIAAVAQSLLGIGQSLLHVGPANFVIYGRFMRAYGTFNQPNPLAGYLNLVLPLALAWAWLRRASAYWAAVPVLGLGVLATFSRAGWAAAAVGVVVVAVVFAPRLRPWPPLVALIALTGLLLATFSLVPISPFLRLAATFHLTGVNFQQYNAANYSEIERAAHWVAGLRMFAHHPVLGVGIGNYPAAYHLYHVPHFVLALGHAHNYFINIAAEAGVVGLAAYLLFLATAVWYALTIARDTHASPTARAVATGVLGAWATSTFHNLFDVLYVHALPSLLGLVMGALLVAHRLGSDRRSRDGFPASHVSEFGSVLTADRATGSLDACRK